MEKETSIINVVEEKGRKKMRTLVAECKKIRSDSLNYAEIRKYPIGKNSEIAEKVDLDEFEKKADTVAVRLKLAFNTK